MFDYMKCELPLPLNKKEQKTFSNVNWNDRVFQTKDTDCTLSTYIIRKNGKLYGLFIEGENVRVISEKEEKKLNMLIVLQSRWKGMSWGDRTGRE